MSSQIRDAVELYLAPNTKRCYRGILDDFEEHCGSVEKVTPTKALKYFASLQTKLAPDGKPLAGATIQLKFQALNSIYNFLEDLDMITKNPLRPVARALSWRQSAQKRPTAKVQFGAVRKILRIEADNPRDDKRNRALMAVSFGTGMRRSEILALNLESVKVSPEGLIFLEIEHAKSGKRQVRTLAKFAWKYLSAYISQRKNDGATEADPLFVFYYQDGKARGRMSEKTLYRIFRDYCARLRIKAAPHAARATFATRLHQLTGSDLLTSDALGHASTSQVRKYVKERDLTVAEIVKSLNYKIH